jgi:VacB/RNase II family 3'-5' exoribonuclease
MTTESVHAASILGGGFGSSPFVVDSCSMSNTRVPSGKRLDASSEIDLPAIARRVMVENGFNPDFTDVVCADVAQSAKQRPDETAVRDLRAMPWSSIDNQESRDLDQIEVSERMPGGDVRILVGIADVDAFVIKGGPTDDHAHDNTCSVYTGVHVFNMLPELLSTDTTSLNEGVDRLAIVIDYVVRPSGEVGKTDVYRARVHNHAKLDYDRVGAWLEGKGEAPGRAAKDAKLQEQLKMQDDAAQRLRKLRYQRGALDLETIEARAVAKDGKVVGLELTHKTRARELIEDFMIAANGVMARFLEAKGVSSIRRVVKSPERWTRIVDLAAQNGRTLPAEPSARALAEFLSDRRAVAPETFADLSLSVVKLMGPGEYALERAGVEHEGHFGLAVQDYTHSTAPNRRYADLITQRLVKSVLVASKQPYDDAALAGIAQRCTQKENDARKVERTMRKVAAATFLSSRIGDQFDAIVTGVSPKGTFVRLVDPPAEGRVVKGEQGLDVGDHLRVKLVDTEPTKGFIDFVRA